MVDGVLGDECTRIILLAHHCLVGELADGFALLEGVLGECRGLVVADDGDETCAHGEGAFDEAFAAGFVGLEPAPTARALEQVLREHVAGAAEEGDAVEEVVDHHGHGDVEVEEGADAAEAAEGDGGVVADDGAADHDEGFTDDRVGFAGHDGRAWLDGGEDEFADAAAGAGAEPADVVGDLGEGDGDGFEDAAGLDDGVLGGLGLEVIGGFAEVDAQACGEFGGDEGAELFVGVDAGADGGAADGEFGEGVEGAVEAFLSVVELGGEAGEFLAEADGCGVLEVGAADFDDFVPGLGFGVEVGGHGLDGGEEA